MTLREVATAYLLTYVACAAGLALTILLWAGTQSGGYALGSLLTGTAIIAGATAVIPAAVVTVLYRRAPGLTGVEPTGEQTGGGA